MGQAALASMLSCLAAHVSWLTCSNMRSIWLAAHLHGMTVEANVRLPCSVYCECITIFGIARLFL